MNVPERAQGRLTLILRRPLACPHSSLPVAATSVSPEMEAVRRDSMFPGRKGTMMTVNTMFGPAPGPHEVPPNLPAPCRRHATPSGPWPFLDIDDPIDPNKLAKPPAQRNPAKDCTHIDRVQCDNCWRHYPQSLFPNWTESQQTKSRIARVIKFRAINSCTIHYSDVNYNGTFSRPQTVPIASEQNEAHWEFMINPRPNTTRLRAMFLDDLSGPVLQMIGTKYNIEPFFWSSSLGWIPSRYQESADPGEGDHITLTLRFIRPTGDPTVTAPSTPTTQHSEDESGDTDSIYSQAESEVVNETINTQAPLRLSSSERMLLPDLLAVHLIRVRPPSEQPAPSTSSDPDRGSSPSSPSSPYSGGSSTLISFHPPTKFQTTPASDLHTRLALVGRSVYWSHIFAEFSDPTFVLLALMWYPLYSWDEAFEWLYKHVCHLEASVVQSHPLEHSHALHIVHAHILHYASLLEDFTKTVVFIRDTSNPALDHSDFDQHELRERSRKRLGQECNGLLREIKRLQDTRSMMAKRLQNVMRLACSRVNIEDSQRMKQLAEASVKDGAAMKQIAYLSMVFLPSSLVANVFSMNVVEINPGGLQTLSHYLIATVLLTLATIWTILAFQYPFKKADPLQTRSNTPRTKPFKSEPPTSHSASKDSIPAMSWSSGWPIALQRALWPAVMISDWLAHRERTNSAREKSKYRHSPQQTRHKKKWPQPPSKLRLRSANGTGRDSITGTSVGSNIELRRESPWWTFGLSWTGRQKEAALQHVIMQSPPPILEEKV